MTKMISYFKSHFIYLKSKACLIIVLISLIYSDEILFVFGFASFFQESSNFFIVRWIQTRNGEVLYTTVSHFLSCIAGFVYFPYECLCFLNAKALENCFLFPGARDLLFVHTLFSLVYTTHPPHRLHSLHISCAHARACAVCEKKKSFHPR